MSKNQNNQEESLVELSSYLHSDTPVFYNEEQFSVERGKPTMIDLFCGAGGFSVGASWAGFQSVLGVDHLLPAMQTWSYNHPHAIGCLGDIRKLSTELIKEKLREKGVEKINLITGRSSMPRIFEKQPKASR